MMRLPASVEEMEQTSSLLIMTWISSFHWILKNRGSIFVILQNSNVIIIQMFLDNQEVMFQKRQIISLKKITAIRVKSFQNISVFNFIKFDYPNIFFWYTSFKNSCLKILRLIKTTRRFFSKPTLDITVRKRLKKETVFE